MSKKISTECIGYRLLFHPQIDLQTFLTLTDQDLKELGITTFGARRKMLLAISGEYKCSYVYFKIWITSASGPSQWGWFCPSTTCLLCWHLVVVVLECFPTNSVTNAENIPTTPSIKALPENLPWQCHSLKQMSSERSNQNCPLQNIRMGEKLNSPFCGCVKQ